MHKWVNEWRKIWLTFAKGLWISSSTIRKDNINNALTTEAFKDDKTLFEEVLVTFYHNWEQTLSQKQNLCLCCEVFTSNSQKYFHWGCLLGKGQRGPFRGGHSWWKVCLSFSFGPHTFLVLECPLDTWKIQQRIKQSSEDSLREKLELQRKLYFAPKKCSCE